MTTSSAVSQPLSDAHRGSFKDHLSQEYQPLVRETQFWVAVAGANKITFYYTMVGCDESEAVELAVQFPSQTSCRKFFDSIPDSITPEQLVTDWGFENIGLV